MLDSMTRFELQDLVLELWEKDRKTCILVTHDIDEALYLSDRIILMTDGPESKVGLELPIPLSRPRDRRELAGKGCGGTLKSGKDSAAALRFAGESLGADNQHYYQLRKEVIDFLEHHSKQFTHQEAA